MMLFTDKHAHSLEKMSLALRTFIYCRQVVYQDSQS